MIYILLSVVRYVPTILVKLGMIERLRYDWRYSAIGNCNHCTKLQHLTANAGRLIARKPDIISKTSITNELVQLRIHSKENMTFKHTEI